MKGVSRGGQDGTAMTVAGGTSLGGGGGGGGD